MGIKAAVSKLASQHGKFARNDHCGAQKLKGNYVVRDDGVVHGDNYPLPYEYDPTFEITRANFNVSNWIDQNTDVFDGCAAFQKILNALHDWGIIYNRGCHRMWKDERKDAWFKAYWKKQVGSYQTALNQKLSNPSTEEGVFRNCQLKSGFDD